MLELIFIWAVTGLGLGFAAIVLALLTRQILRSIGRVVFVEDKDVTITDANGHSPA